MGKEPLTQSVAQTRPFSVFGNMANATSNALRISVKPSAITGLTGYASKQRA